MTGVQTCAFPICGGSSDDSRITPGCHGGSGAVRIIWGTINAAGTSTASRSFPSTNTSDMT